MYVFVRFSGIVLIVAGLLLMVVGFGGALYLALQQETLLGTINQYLLSNGAGRVVTMDFMLYLSLYALIFFIIGMLTAAFGQLMLVFADIGSNSRETNILLRSLRRRDL